MLLRMLELNDPVNYPVNRIVFCDTTFEFPELYAYLDRVQAYIDEHYPERGLKIERAYAKKPWKEWFYGKVESGKAKGQVRGVPLKLYPCYWTKTSKLDPMDRMAKESNCDFMYIGIAHDEQKRIRDSDPRYRYPLNEWKWTESDCMDYLDHHGIALELYTVFNRLGCYHCPKQSFRSWYSLWLHFPELWKDAKFWDSESIRLAGHGLTMRDESSLEELEVKFKQGYIPKGTVGMDCRSCSAITLKQEGIISMEDFFEGDEFERDEEVLRSDGKYAHLNDAEKVEWIPPSHANNLVVKTASMNDWFLDGINEEPDEADCFFDVSEEE